MLADTLRSHPAPMSLGAAAVGVFLIAWGSLPLAVVGIALLVLAFLVPFLRLSVLSVTTREPVRRGEDENDPSPSAPPGSTMVSPAAGATSARPRSRGRAVATPKTKSWASKRGVGAANGAKGDAGHGSSPPHDQETGTGARRTR